MIELSAGCQVCGANVYARVAPTPGDEPAILADLALLVADLITANASPENLQVAAALSDAQLAHDRRDVRTYTPLRSAGL